MTGSDKALATIRKLLAKAEDPSVTTAEADAYNAKAADLIAAYGIDRALLAQAQPGTDTPADKIIIIDPPYALDKVSLLSGIAQALRCRCVYLTRYPGLRKETSVHLFGFGSDIERAELLYTSLLIQAAHGLVRTVIPRYEHPAAYRRSWLQGFTLAIIGRLRQAEHNAEQHATRTQAASGPPVALVLVSRSERVTQRLNAAYPKLRTAQARRLSGSGRRQGYQAGQRADIGTTSLRTAPGRAISPGDN